MDEPGEFLYATWRLTSSITKAASVRTFLADQQHEEFGDCLSEEQLQNGHEKDAFDEERPPSVNRRFSTSPAEEKVTGRQVFLVLRPYFWPGPTSDNWKINRIRCLSVCILIILSKVSTVLAPIFLAHAVNNIYVMEKATFYIGIYCILVFGGTFFEESQNLVYLGVRKAASTQISRETFKHLLNLSIGWQVRTKIGKTIRALDRGMDAIGIIVEYTLFFLIPTAGECLAVCIIFLTHFRQWYLSILLLISLGLYAGVTLLMAHQRQYCRQQRNKQEDAIHGQATDCLMNFETVKAFTSEEYQQKEYEKKVINFQHYDAETDAVLSRLSIMQQFVLQVCRFGILVLTTWKVSLGKMSVGGFVAINTYVIEAFSPLTSLSSIYNSVAKALIDMENLRKLLDQEPDIVDRPGAIELKPPTSTGGLALKFERVSFCYPQQRVNGLDNVTFEVPAGTTTALVGHTGSGKSTIARLLFRYYDPVQGKVLVSTSNGRYWTNAKDATQASLRKLLGVVPQDCCLFHDTLRNNIRYGRSDASDKEVEDIARRAGLEMDLETIVGEKGAMLSGGQKQRVAIARCLIKNPHVVVLDEATSALDAETERHITRVVDELKSRGVSMLVIAHRLTTIQKADQILVMDKGRILEVGTHDELLKVQGIYARMWQLQQHEEIIQTTE